MSLPEIQDHFDSTQNSIILNNIIDMMEKFVKKIDKFSKNKILINTFDIFSIDGIKTAIKDLKINIECNKRKKMKCVFFGKTSSGKSAALNALIKENILPSGIGRTTSCFITVEGCEEETGYLIDKNGTRPYYSNIMYNENDGDQETYNIDSKVTVMWPKTKCTILNNEIQLIDSPGFDCTVKQDKDIEDRCLDADVFVYVIDAVSSINFSERKFFKKVQSKVADPNIFILMNKWDKCERELSTQKLEKIKQKQLTEVKSFFEDHLQMPFDGRIYFVSAKEMLEETTLTECANRKIEFNKFVDTLNRETSDNVNITKFKRHLDKETMCLNLLLKVINKIINTRQGNMSDIFDDNGLKLKLFSLQDLHFQYAKIELNNLVHQKSQEFVLYVMENVNKRAEINDKINNVVRQIMENLFRIKHKVAKEIVNGTRILIAVSSQINETFNFIDDYLPTIIDQEQKPITQGATSSITDIDSERFVSNNVSSFTQEGSSNTSQYDILSKITSESLRIELELLFSDKKIAKLETRRQNIEKKVFSIAKLNTETHYIFFKTFLKLLQDIQKNIQEYTSLLTDEFFKNHREYCKFIITMEELRVSCEFQLKDVNNLINTIPNYRNI